MTVDSFKTFYSSKGFEPGKMAFGEVYQSQGIPVYMYRINQGQVDNVRYDTIHDGAMVRYSTADTSAAGVFEKQLLQYGLIEKSSDLRYSYINSQSVYKAGAVKIIYSISDGYSSVLIIPIDDENVSDRKDSSVNSNRSNADAVSGTGSGSCADAGTSTSEKELNGSGYNINNRNAIEIPKPDASAGPGGLIKVTVWVNRQGDVVRAQAGAIGTTISDQKLWRECEVKALSAKFSKCPNCAAEMKGTITFTFIKTE